MEKENMKKDEALKALQIHVSEETVKASTLFFLCVCACMFTHMPSHECEGRGQLAIVNFLLLSYGSQE